MTNRLNARAIDSKNENVFHPMKRGFSENSQSTKRVKKVGDLSILGVSSNVIHLIFGHLNYFEQLSLARTCKQFFALERSLGRKSIVFSDVGYGHCLVPKQLRDLHVLNFFRISNFRNLEWISFSQCTSITSGAIKFVLTACPRLKTLHLENSKISFADIAVLLIQTIPKEFSNLFMGISRRDGVIHQQNVQNICSHRKINFDIHSCTSCMDQIVLKRQICRTCFRVECMNCRFVFFCEHCSINHCDDCAQMWMICDRCGRTACVRRGDIRICVNCGKTTCPGHCECMEVQNEDDFPNF